MELAVLTAPHMTKELMQVRFDLASQIEQIIERIRGWDA